MVTITKVVDENGGIKYECYGKSSDTKPVDKMTNGSAFYEMDTGSLFMFDADTKSWLAQ